MNTRKINGNDVRRDHSVQATHDTIDLFPGQRALLASQQWHPVPGERWSDEVNSLARQKERAIHRWPLLLTVLGTPILEAG